MLEVGGIFARAGVKLDDDGFDKFERRYHAAERMAHDDIQAHAKLDYDKRGFDAFDRKLNDTEHHADRSTRTYGRLSKAGVGVGVAMGGALVAGVGAAGLAVGKAVSEFEDAAKVGAQTEAVIKSTGGSAGVTAKQVEELATKLSNKSAIDDEAIQSGANLLLTFTNIRNEAGKGNDIFDQSTSILTDMSVAMGTDVSSSAIQLGKALNDPVKGITALTRVGVTFTDAQKEQITSLVESGKSMEAQKIILRELNKEFGGSAEAQARPLQRAKVAVDNLFESLGRKLAPTITVVANGIADFITGMEEGTGAGGKFARILERAGDVAVDVGRFFVNAFNRIRSAFSGGNKDATGWANTIRRHIALVIRTAVDLGRRIARTFDGMGDELRTIGRAWLKMQAVFAAVAAAVARRVIPALAGAIEGLARIIRGVVKIIAGILSGDFGKAWDGVKDIFSGAVKAVGAILRGSVGLIGDAAGAITSRILRVIGKLPGALFDLGKRAVSSLARGLAGVGSAILGAFGSAGQFFGNIGRGIADWINANTPFGDRIKVGPVSVNLPALRRGGKAGPGEGGPAIVYGEGSKAEWWISQEGDRGKNIAWGREALESLTGRRVAFYRDGGRRAGSSSKPRRAPKAIRKARRAVSNIAKREHGFAVIEERINNWEDSYDTLERTYALDDTDLLIEQPDGSTIVDTAAVANRVKDLELLADLRKKIADELAKYKAKIKAAVTAYLKAIKTLKKALAAATGKKNRDTRDNYRTLIEDYSNRVTELGGTGALKGKITGGLWHEIQDQENDSRLDYVDLVTEKGAVAGTTGEPAPDGGAGGAPASAEDIARAAAEQLGALQAGRASLFENYGANFAAAGVNPFAGDTGQMAGLRYFGAKAGGDAGAGGGTTINQTFNFGGGPEDELTFSQRVAGEIKAAVG